MARPIVADRVKETTNTTGTGTLSLAGNATGFQSFVGAGLGGKPTYYAIVDDPTATTEWEVGIGTVTAGTPNTLSRDRVIASSNSGSKVSWSAGTKTVIVTSVSETFNAIMDTVDSDLVTAGSSTAYTLTTNRPAVGLYEGRFVCFKLDETCGADPTLDVDSAGAVNLVDINGTNITSGALVADAYYWAKYNASTAKWVVFSPLGILDGSITSAKLAANIAIAGTFALTGDITPAQITAGTNDYNPTGLSTAAILRLSTDATRSLSGLVGGSDGRQIQIRNVGLFNLTLAHNSTASTPANRFDLPSGATLTLLPTESVDLIYDATLSRWTVKGSTAPTRAASTDLLGAVEKATQAETNGGTADKYPSAAQLKAMLFESAEFAITAAANSQTIAHGLGVYPKHVWSVYRCLSTEHGYPAGAEVPSNYFIAGSANVGALAYAIDATNLGYVIGSTSVAIMHATSGVVNGIVLDPAKWRLVIYAKPY